MPFFAKRFKRKGRQEEMARRFTALNDVFLSSFDRSSCLASERTFLPSFYYILLLLIFNCLQSCGNAKRSKKAFFCRKQGRFMRIQINFHFIHFFLNLFKTIIMPNHARDNNFKLQIFIQLFIKFFC